MQEIFPELVKEGLNGMLSVDYIGLIPIIVESIKEQQQMINIQSEMIKNQLERIEQLEKIVSSLSETSIIRFGTEKSAQSNSLTSLNDSPTQNPHVAVLYQNAPNPFTEQTEIKFSLSESAVNAIIYLFDMNGAIIKQIPVNTRQSSVVISGSELAAGMYLYSLIVDGKEVDTKRMILTK